MRIGLVSPYSLSHFGGVQGQVLAQARALRRLGHTVEVLGPCDGPVPEPDVTCLGSTMRLPANGSMVPLSPGPLCARRTRAAVRDGGFDVVHIHEPLVPGPALWSLLFADGPSVGTFHAAGVSAAYRWAGFALRPIANRLDVRCAVSDDAVELAQRHLGGSYEPLFNGVEVARFAAAEPWPTEGPTVLFVGRHEERKGLAVLLEALPKLPDDARVWVVGDGPDSAALRASVAGDDRVEWLGAVDDEEKARRLRGADVFCAPSLRGESFGVILLEAMAAGTPIVASQLSGYAKVARHGVEGLLVPVGDAGALGDALVQILDDARLRAELAAAGRARALELSTDRLAERYVEIYARLLGR